MRYQDPMSEHASILVVDDEPHVSDMLQEFFLELGYAVDVATTGDEAVRRASSKRPDAVILDMRLPDTTGDQLLTRLRTLDGSVPIVMLSGDTDDDVARRTVAAGAFQYLQKPFDFELLQQTITRAVVAGREHHRLATLFGQWVDGADDWQLMAPVPLGLVCFRWAGRGVSDAELDRRNEAIMHAVNASGEVFLSHTKLDGRFTLRLSVGNIRTEERHLARAWELLQHAASS